LLKGLLTKKYEKSHIYNKSYKFHVLKTVNM